MDIAEILERKCFELEYLWKKLLRSIFVEKKLEKTCNLDF